MTFTVEKNGVATAAVVSVPATFTGIVSFSGAVAFAENETFAVRVLGATSGQITGQATFLLE